MRKAPSRRRDDTGSLSGFTMSSDELPLSLTPDLESELKLIQVVKYVLVSSAALFAYDHLCTLPLEIKYIWQGDWRRGRIGKALYVMIRCIAIIDLAIFLSVFLNLQLTPTTCTNLFWVGSFFVMVGGLLGVLVVAIRTWAMWGCSKKIMMVLLCLNVTEIGAVYFVVAYLRNITFTSSPIPSIVGCFSYSSKGHLQNAYALQMVQEFVPVALMIAQGIRQRDTLKNPINRTLYTDAITFFACLFATTCAIFVTYLKAKSLLSSQVLPVMQHILHCILTSRVILHIHDAANKSASTVRNTEVISETLLFNVGEESEAQSQTMFSSETSTFDLSTSGNRGSYGNV